MIIDIPASFGCGGPPPPGAGLHVLPWVCPLCEGTGQWSDGDRCAECTGRGLLADKPDPETWEGYTIRRAPRPPAVAPAKCRDCAFRPGSPEAEAPPPLDRPFYCHHGTQPTAYGYSAPIMFDGAPIGERVCAGWWEAVTGEDPADTAPYADTHPHGVFPAEETSS